MPFKLCFSTTMLNRRQLRIKTLQSLYAFQQSGNDSIAIGEKELLHSIDRIFDLYFYVLAIAVEMKHFAQKRIDEAKTKLMPTYDDLNPNMRFVENFALTLIETNKNYIENIEKRKINWSDNNNFIRNLFAVFSESKVFQDYMNAEVSDFKNDKEIITVLFNDFVLESEDLNSLLEEKSIYWVSDLDMVGSFIIKTISELKKNTDTDGMLLKGVYFNQGINAEDKEFILDLFRKTIKRNAEFEELIKKQTKNWELERIALIDILLMKMALCEVTEFSSIPIKVSLNEYIEISKYFSTPKSRMFINGILDKIVIELKNNNKISKTGRGLLEN